MFKKMVFLGGVAVVFLLSQSALAGVITFNFSGATASGNGTLTIVPNTSPADPNPDCGASGNNACRQDPAGAYRISNITGYFSDTSLGITNASITGLVATSPANERDAIFDPHPPTSLSFMGGTRPANDTTGVPADYFAYDNLFYPNGSPVVCDFPWTGTLLDVYGIAFTLDTGDSVDLWGDGDLGGGPLTYGVGVLNNGKPSYAQRNSQFSGVNFAVPAPDSALMLASGLVLFAAFAMAFGKFEDKRSVSV